MLVYSSVREFVKEQEPGSILLVPSMLLRFMSVHLDPRLLLTKHEDRRTPRLSKAPFYVLKADPLITALEETKTEKGLSGRGEVSVPGTAEVGKVSVEVSMRQETRRMRVKDPTMPGATRIYDIESQIESILNTKREAINGRAVFVYLPFFTPRTLDVVTAIQLVASRGGSVPTFVMLPLRLDELYEVQIKGLQKLVESGYKEMSLLLGLEPAPVYIEIDKKTKEYPLPRYLITKMFESILPDDDLGRKYVNSEFAADEVIRWLFRDEANKYVRSTALSPNPENVYSVSTVFLDMLCSTITKEYKIYFSEYPYDSLRDFVHYLSAIAEIRVMNRLDNLANIAAHLGSSDDTIKAIRSGGWILHPNDFSSARIVEHAKRWKRAQSEEEYQLVSESL